MIKFVKKSWPTSAPELAETEGIADNSSSLSNIEVLSP